MGDIAVYVENLGKRYRIGGVQKSYRTIRETLVEAVQAPFRRLASVMRGQSSTVAQDTIWALKDVSFQVDHGEVIGIIGRNGAGKSTLLKILSRITDPTEGCVKLSGRVGSLLEVGTGFHPELTGRENIYLNGAILGMKRAEIEERFDEIVAFSEIKKFIDTPVKHYSSGMYVRLAFSVAAHLEPEILLVDEVLSVGDAAFQKKCLGRMESVARGGRTVIFVSHNMAAVQSLCTRALLIDEGHIVADGKPLPIIEQYLSQVQIGNGIFDLTDHPHGGEGVLLDQLRVIDSTMKPTPAVPMGRALGFEIDFRSDVPLDRGEFIIAVFNSLKQRVCRFSSVQSGFFLDSDIREATIRCFLPQAHFTAGRYYLSAVVAGHNRQRWHASYFDAAAFDVVEADVFGTGKIPDGGPCFFNADWYCNDHK